MQSKDETSISSVVVIFMTLVLENNNKSKMQVSEIYHDVLIFKRLN